MLWRRLWLIALVATVLSSVALAFSLAQTPTYESSMMVLIGQKRADDGATGDLGNELQGLERLTGTVAAAVTTRPIAEGVVRKLDLGKDPSELQAGLSAEVVPDTTFVRISYSDTDPERARQAVNAVGGVLSERISEVSPSANAVSATVWEEATASGAPVSPDPLRNVVLALALGVMLGTGLAFLLEYMDDKWRSPEEVEQVAGVPNFGVIPASGHRRSMKEGG